MSVVRNPMRRAGFDPGMVPTAPRGFHRKLAGYAPTPLRVTDVLAAELGVADVLVKDEYERFGLPAFKMLGASWATYLALEDRRGHPFEHWDTIEDLREQVAELGPLTLATPTDGNHGRAVARMAALLGLAARVRVPNDTVAARIDAIAGEGAEVTISSGGYDDAVAEVAAWADERTLVISDTSWEGYEDVPAWIIEGYSTIFAEVAEQFADAGSPGPTVVCVPVGVGAFAAATVGAYRRPDEEPALVAAVEPVDAACVMASAVAGEVITLEGEQHSIMAGLNCGTPSPIAWPLVSQGVDVFVTVTDDEARAAMRALADVGVVSGESGAASYAGAVQLAAAGRLVASDRVLLLSTEGATDPVAYEQIVGHPPPSRPMSPAT
ncbi:MAG: diaminopropionate ammonia-lyase [Ilumatobacteraceae bacterium]